MDDTLRVLVTYASAAGSTEGVARRIAEVLTSAGAEVVCRPVTPDLQPGGFDAVVVGSAVHDMSWLPEPLELLRRLPGEPGPPVWCFSVGGLRAPERSRLTRRLAAGERRRIEQRFPAALRPRDHRLFAGAVRLEHAPLWARLFYAVTGTGNGDHRDWPAIESWADGIATELSVPGVPAPEPVVPDPHRRPGSGRSARR